MYVCVCVCMSLCLCVCMCMYVCVCITYKCTYIVCVHVHMYVYHNHGYTYCQFHERDKSAVVPQSFWQGQPLYMYICSVHGSYMYIHVPTYMQYIGSTVQCGKVPPREIKVLCRRKYVCGLVMCMYLPKRVYCT